MKANLRVVSSTVAAMPLDAGVNHWLERLAARGARPNTIKAYGSDMRQFVAFTQGLGQGALVALISQRMVARWLDDLTASGVCARSSSRKLTVLRGFVKHARREGWLHHDPTQDERVRFRKTRVVAPELEQMHAMVDAIPTRGALNIRDHAMLRLGLDSGLRISEVACLDMPGTGLQTSLDLARRIVHVIGKGGDTESVPFNDKTAAALEDWLRVRADLAQPGEVALFVTLHGVRPSRQTLHVIVRKWGVFAGMEKFHWHLFRHRRISHLVSVCGVKVAQQFARHANETTTGEYGRHSDNVAFDLVRQLGDVDAGRKSA